ncbi:FAD/NAD(P)-binding oxidoreductase [Ferroplasma sp.]|uniref:NAD(P)/FAD-dependent oxidoreductase n=1 Tax=Ferroplasma sp. TaxID=2591003 RepID=UPI00261A2D07|nr:FAD/NAD(P)-binding oxidoreductase [Ferroplasma sp.]MCL4453084.1 NAD(P)/FAD-dependent oxidoreductase [Candidatus Thermoplasmatota archaeon]
MNKINVIILGDANAGIITANKLRMRTGNDVEITIVGDSDKTYFKPEGVLIPFYGIDYRDTVKPTDSLINYGIKRIKSMAKKINPDNRQVILENGAILEYDYLVIATGDRLVPENVPGYNSDIYHFYDMEHVIKLREKLKTIKGGKIVVGPASIPFQCPVAPEEFVFGLDALLRKKGVRGKSEITLIVPMDDVLPFKNVSDLEKKGFSDLGINFVPKFKTQNVDPDQHVIISESGESIDYDTLILIPPHMGQKVIMESGMGAGNGYIDVDKFTMRYRDYDNVYVVGDAANFPMKVGALGHSEAAYVAGRIASDTDGTYNEDKFDGFMGCSSVYPGQTGFTLSFDYYSKPFVNFASKTDYFLKYISGDTYFSSIIRGIL